MIIAGIDYSLTSPSVCIHDGEKWDHGKCKFYYLAKKKSNIIKTNQFYGTEYKDFNSDSHRYDNLSSWVLNILSANGVQRCFIEGYSYGSVGRVFQIGENTGVLKHAMWKKSFQYDVFAPTEIKKFATGKGNANKLKMYESFVAETGIDIRFILDIKNENNWNPISDIIDAYWIAKLGNEKLNG